MQPQVLVLEDEPLIAMLLSDWLSEFGCGIVGPVRSVASALELIRRSQIDAALLDIAIGEDDCFSVAAELRRRGIPFAFASGTNAVQLDAGIADTPFILKPYVFEAVRGVVRQLVGRDWASVG